MRGRGQIPRDFRAGPSGEPGATFMIIAAQRRTPAPATPLKKALRQAAYACIRLCVAKALAQSLVKADDRLVARSRASSPGRFADVATPLVDLASPLAARRG